MRLLERNSAGQLSLTKDLIGDDIPEYAILSHTWGVDTEEVTFRDLMDGTAKSKAGYDKIRFCREKATHDGLKYFWVDTCCIDKSSSAELAEATNSMFQWYSRAVKCYACLSDVSVPDHDERQLTWEPAFRNSRWFTRGWMHYSSPFCSVREGMSDVASRLRRNVSSTGLERENRSFSSSYDNVTVDFRPNIALCHTSKTRDHNVHIQDPYILLYLLYKNSYKYSFSVCPFVFSRKATFLQFPR
ncbi:uncharacterized protein PAC_18310 [Phialocephala subalpina]|uniref:Heterokaryon incompatibility domain-containing protein n=1 Tax=Phialocephala subalpina TaxID=576137 RepID=A0A1L7XTP7_9HELO|nr:uncharacterized protein PAC_18310 [Phialocephala subalpina]